MTVVISHPILHALFRSSDVRVACPPVTVERRKPDETPADPEVTAELRAADEEARQEAAERKSELLDRLRDL
jgi:hypothetical protein